MGKLKTWLKGKLRPELMMLGPPTRRWGYFALVALVATVGCCFLFVMCEAVGRSTSSWFCDLSAWVRFLGRIFVTTVVVGMLLRQMPVHWSQFKYIWHWPPTWLGVATGFLLACLFDVCGALGAANFRPPWWEWPVLVIVGLAVVGVVRWITTPAPSPEAEEASSSGLLQAVDWTLLEPWLRIETPADEDFLNRRPIARRFARHLLLPFGQDRTLGLVGDFGSGKSSIVRWLKEEMRPVQAAGALEVWICEVSCWGFEDSASAIQHILSTAVKEVSRHADCFSLRQIPDAYRKSLSAGGAWLPSVADLVLGQPDPTDSLKRLSPILEAVRARLVIVVEDLDRNRTAKFDVQDVLATLQRLRSVKGVSFLLTGGSSATSKIDFARLCDHIETMPDLEEEPALGLIRVLRCQCLSSVRINPNDTPQRSEEALWGDVRQREHRRAHMGLDRMTVTRAALKLLSTPRALKHALRHTWTVWQHLCGEIDFDDLLVANILRHSAPEAFNFLLRRMDTLRVEQGRERLGRSREHAEEREGAIRDEWQEITKAVEWDIQAAQELICLLVPNGDQIFLGKPPISQSCPQGVRHASPTDYWRRLLAEELQRDEPRDQEVLVAIEEWMREPNADKPLVQKLASEERFAEIWGHFGDRVFGKRPLLLAAQVIEAVLQKEKARASDDIPGLSAMRRRLIRYGTDDRNNSQWLQDQITYALPRSLSLACDLYDDWADPRTGFVKQTEIDDMRTAMVDAAKAHFTTADPQALLSALDESRPYALRWLVMPPDNDKKSVLREPEDWQWFAPVMLAGARLDHRKMIPLIGYLLIESAGDAHDTRVVLVMERVKAIFGEQTNEALQLLTREIVPISDSERALLPLLREQALAALAMHPEVEATTAKQTKEMGNTEATADPVST